MHGSQPGGISQASGRQFRFEGYAQVPQDPGIAAREPAAAQPVSANNELGCPNLAASGRQGKKGQGNRDPPASAETAWPDRRAGRRLAVRTRLALTGDTNEQP